MFLIQIAFSLDGGGGVSSLGQIRIDFYSRGSYTKNSCFDDSTPGSLPSEIQIRLDVLVTFGAASAGAFVGEQHDCGGRVPQKLRQEFYVATSPHFSAV